MSYWEMQKLLHGRGLTKQQRQELTESMGPDVFSMEGRMGDEVTVTGSSPGSASGVFATLGSSGPTLRERQESLALPSSNTAEVEETRYLGFDQSVLEGEVAPQGLPYMLPSNVFTQPREGGWKANRDCWG
jgi:hypothetical protein